MKTILDVPFDKKDSAKARGARWDPAIKKWYCPDGLDLKDFKQWLPKELQGWLGHLPRKQK
jgi:hypothetical protein